MKPTLDTLEMPAEDREVAQNAIRSLAFSLWCNAGCPLGDDLDFWLAAEQQWIEFDYVPFRPWDAE
jgi:hypothetical protein